MFAFILLELVAFIGSFTGALSRHCEREKGESLHCIQLRSHILIEFDILKVSYLVYLPRFMVAERGSDLQD